MCSYVGHPYPVGSKSVPTSLPQFSTRVAGATTMALLTTGTPSGPWRSSVHSRVSTCRVLLQHHKRSNKHAPSAEMGSACSEGFPVHTTRPLGHCEQLLQLRQQLQFYHRAQKVPAGVQVVRYNCHPRPISAARMQMELVCSECFPCRTTRAFRRVLDCCSSGSSSTPSAYLREFNASQASSHPRPISSARRQPPVAAAVPATLHKLGDLQRGHKAHAAVLHGSTSAHPCLSHPRPISPARMQPPVAAHAAVQQQQQQLPPCTTQCRCATW